MISFEDVSLLGPNDQPFLEGFSAKIERGEKVALVGASGSGKSSLLRCAVGGISNWQGKVFVGDLELSETTILSIRNDCGYIPQEPRLPDNLIQEFLEEFFSGFKLNWKGPVRNKVLELCKYLLLPDDIFELSCRKLSGGQRQRLVIATIVALDKKIILADEITSALDKESKKRVIDLFFNENITVLSVSHDPEWCNSCDRVIDITKRRGEV